MVTGAKIRVYLVEYELITLTGHVRSLQSLVGVLL